MSYLMNVLPKPAANGATPQSEPILGTTQVPNSAGGYSFPVDDWVRLDRFLVLGSEGGTYYATERALTAENAGAAVRCIAADGLRVVRRVVEISRAGRAPKNDPALFVLALVAAKGDGVARAAVVAALPDVARTGTHLLHFAQYADGMRGWGRGLRRALGRWFTGQPAAAVAFQAVKYQSRDGWAQRDLLRLAHPKPPTEQHTAVFHWITQGWPDVGEAPHSDEALRLIWAFERAKRAMDAAEVAKLVREYRLPREAVPTAFLREKDVWAALLDADMPTTALIRNLATMTRVGLLGPLSEAAKTVCAHLGDEARLRAARVHPIQVLAALKTYGQGHGERGNATWQPVAQVVDALDAAFYASFGLLEPTGKRWVLGLDVSGSMDGGTVAGVPGLTPRVASAAMAMVTARTEPEHAFVAFTDAGGGLNSYSSIYGLGRQQVLDDPDAGITRVAFSPRQRLDDVVKQMQALPMGGTDCALPMLWATKHKVPADVFVILTDSETWAGAIHPTQALKQYRQAMGIPAKLVVCGMTPSQFSIADPDDSGMLDVVGFDTATPELIGGFARGAI